MDKVTILPVECLVGVCLALRTLVREVKRTLTTVGSWLGAQLSLSTKHGLILGPRNKNLVYQLYSAWLCGRCTLCAPRTRSSTQLNPVIKGKKPGAMGIPLPLMSACQPADVLGGMVNCRKNFGENCIQRRIHISKWTARTGGPSK